MLLNAGDIISGASLQHRASQRSSISHPSVFHSERVLTCLPMFQQEALTRIPRKNIRHLAGKPILGRVIEALRDLSFINAVHVSTDDDEIAEVATSFGATCLAPRSPDLADSQSGFTDLIRNDIPRYVEANDGDSEVLFVLATAALVPPSIYEDAWKVYEKDRPEILMSCEPYDEPIWWAFEQKNRWVLVPGLFRTRYLPTRRTFRCLSPTRVSSICSTRKS